MRRRARSASHEADVGDPDRDEEVPLETAMSESHRDLVVRRLQDAVSSRSPIGLRT